MAGSYNHVVNKETGALRENLPLLDMLDCHHGDVYEAIEEMYGMIWYLAGQLDENLPHAGPGSQAELVEQARKNYEIGLQESPTERFKRKS